MGYQTEMDIPTKLTRAFYRLLHIQRMKIPGKSLNYNAIGSFLLSTWMKDICLLIDKSGKRN